MDVGESVAEKLVVNLCVFAFPWQIHCDGHPGITLHRHFPPSPPAASLIIPAWQGKRETPLTTPSALEFCMTCRVGCPQSIDSTGGLYPGVARGLDSTP